MRNSLTGPVLAAIATTAAASSLRAEIQSEGFLETWIRYGGGRFLSTEVKADYEVKGTFGGEEKPSASDDPFADFGVTAEQRLPEARARVRGWVDPEGFEELAKLELYTGGLTVYPQDDISLFLGQDFVIWGKADKINPVDVVNAEDFTQFLAKPKLGRKLSNLMMNLVYAKGDDKLQFIYNPFYEQHELASRDSPWCGTRCQFAQPKPNPPFVTVDDSKSDERTIADSEFAVRYSSRVERVDYSVVVHNGFDRFPVWSHRFTGPTSIEFTRELERRWRFGGDLAFTLGSFGIRAEVLYQPDSVQHYAPDTPEFFTDDDGLNDVDQINWVVGVDWTTDSDVYVNVQFAENWLDGGSEYFRTSFDRLGTLQLSRRFLNDDLEAKVTGFYEFADDSSALTPEIVYRVSDDLRWTTGFWVFWGDPGTFFGDQNANDHVFTHLKYLF
jgi:hypothetical protein